MSVGAKVDLVNRSGETPLHVAAERGLATLATALLVAGADPNIQVQYIHILSRHVFIFRWKKTNRKNSKPKYF